MRVEISFTWKGKLLSFDKKKLWTFSCPLLFRMFDDLRNNCSKTLVKENFCGQNHLSQNCKIYNTDISLHYRQNHVFYKIAVVKIAKNCTL